MDNNFLETNDFTPVIIIGAARSGTNMLRDILTRLPGFGTWPCDEINYIWRHHNAHYPTDDFPTEFATPRVKSYVRNEFSRLAEKGKLTHVVEKTCANSLRVAFVDSIFPQAKFIYIVRDGRDVAMSAAKRWKARLDMSYILRKARYVPLNDIPYYASKYLYNRIFRFFSNEKRLAYWGPRFKGYEEVIKCYPLPVVCTIQWKISVENADRDFNNMESTRVFRMRYEDSVQNPVKELQRLLNFLETDITSSSLNSLVQNVSSGSIGRWKTQMDREIQTEVESIIRETMQRHGYE